MMQRFFRTHRGSTMVELMIYIAMVAIVMGATMPLLFMASEDRLLQQTISVVEENGTQVLQNLTFRIRNAERIVSPAIGQSGSVLVLQTASGATNPTIMGMYSGAILFIEGTRSQKITSAQIAVLDFKVRNTSVSANRQSAEISFHISRTTRLLQPHFYMQYFQTAVTLFPDDKNASNAVSCSAPVCSPANIFSWQVYNSTLNQCLDSMQPIHCP